MESSSLARRKGFVAAARASLPVFLGYIPLGMAFGLLLRDIGYGVGVAAAMSLFVYGGSTQFMAVSLFSSGAGLAETFAITFFLSSRHMVYGLSLLQKFEGLGARKPYMIYALTDEAYALFVGTEPPEGVDRKSYMVSISLLCHGYWILGGVLGSLLGAVLQFNTVGMDFVLTALFIVLTIDLWESYKTPVPFLIGAGFGLVAVILFGGRAMMPAALVGILITLAGARRPIEANLNAAVEKGGEGTAA